MFLLCQHAICLTDSVVFVPVDAIFVFPSNLIGDAWAGAAAAVSLCLLLMICLHITRCTTAIMKASIGLH